MHPALKNILIGLLIFAICGVIGYFGTYVVFNVAHWTGKLKPVETVEQTFDEASRVMYVLYDNTALYVEESLDSQVIDTLSRGEAVTVLATNDTFAKVRRENGLMGYVPLEVISSEDPTIGEKSPTEFIDPTPIPTEPTEITTKPEPTETSAQPTDSESSSETTPSESSSETSETSESESSSESTPESSDTIPTDKPTPTPSEESTTPSSSSETEATEPSSESTPDAGTPDDGTPDDGNGEGA
jgi:uncharacterized protein YgiM (DUF1202 family)